MQQAFRGGWAEGVADGGETLSLLEAVVCKDAIVVVGAGLTGVRGFETSITI